MIAELCVVCGLPWESALDHSPARLRLIREAAARLKASDALAAVQAAHAGSAGCVSNEGHRYLKRVMKELEQRMNNG